MQKITLYHNPRCSKSRQTLALLREHQIEPTIIDYLNTPPSSAELKKLLNALGMTPRELMRKKESLYKELNLNDDSLSEADLINAMTEHPRLIERPIVVVGHKAVLGRPPENILEIIT